MSRFRRADDPVYPPRRVMTQDARTHQYGLTIREHFAALAMQGLCGGPAANGHFGRYEDLGFASAEALMAKMAVDIADALIAELAKTGGST